MSEKLAGLLLLFSLIPAAWAAPAPKRTSPVASPPMAPFWLRTYPVREFGLFWHAEVEVKNGAKARKKLIALMKKHNGRSQQPLEVMAAKIDLAYQQFSFRIDKKEAGAVLEALGKEGRVSKLSQKENPVPEINDELRIKLEKLASERESGRTQLAQLPTVSAVLDELLGHLQTAYIAYKDSADRVLFNIILVEAKAPAKP